MLSFKINKLYFLIALFFCQHYWCQNLDGYNELCDKYLENTVTQIELTKLQSLLENGAILILDTRELKEYKISHIQGAIHVGYKEFNFSSLKEITKETVICVYCSIGYRSEKIGLQLIKQGYHNTYNLKGGVFSWANSGHFLYDNNNKRTKNIHGFNKKWSKWINPKACDVVIN